jgi:hypothetical protein
MFPYKDEKMDFLRFCPKGQNMNNRRYNLRIKQIVIAFRATTRNLARNLLSNRGMLKQVQHDATFNPDGLPNRRIALSVSFTTGYSNYFLTEIFKSKNTNKILNINTL